MIGEPPLDEGATKATVAEALPAVAEAPVGAPGTVAGVTGLLAADAGPAPIALLAVTVNVYAWPFVRPVTTWESEAEPAFESVPPDGDEVTA